MITPHATVDMSGFNRGFGMASQFTRKAPADAANYAGREVAFGAWQNTPFVTPTVIDAELHVVKADVIGKRGKPLKNKKRFVASKDNGVPMAVLVVQARANPSSHYNALTNSRYALTASPFKGLSREAGRAAMAAMVDLMTKNRHRSTHFIASGWLGAIRDLKSVIPSKFGGSRAPTVQNDALGKASPACPGIQAYCIIENDVGLEGQNAISHNRALMLTLPALQNSLDTVGRREMQYALSKMGKEDFEIPVNKAWA